MVVDMGLVKSVNEAGFFSGAMTSSVYFGRLITSYYWGYSADTHGRKLILCISIVSVSGLTLLFGFSKSFWVAMLARFLLGLMNPISGLVNTYISDICSKHSSHESFAMGLVSSSYSLGFILGPAFGGYLVFPKRKYPNTFQNMFIFEEYPYLFPNLLIAILGFIIFISMIFVLPETYHHSYMPISTSNDNNIIPPSRKSSYSNSKYYCSWCEIISYYISIGGVIATLVCYFLLAFVSTIFDEVYLLWTLCSTEIGKL
jgi:MFS family permease